jgi:hypothetical protein
MLGEEPAGSGSATSRHARFRRAGVLVAAALLGCQAYNRGDYADRTQIGEGGVAPRTVAIFAGREHTCAVQNVGRVVCWGAGDRAQTGTGAVGTVYHPMAPVVGLDHAAEVAPGGQHTCARLGSDDVWCWGANQWGQVANGTRVDLVTAPTHVTLDPAAEIASEGDATCARLRDGRVMCWGGNCCGQLGPGAIALTSATLLPAPAAIGLGVGESNVCIVSTSRTVLCAGRNNAGQIGNGMTGGNVVTPTLALGLNDAARVAPGFEHVCAMRRDGHVLCWGSNAQGQLGVSEVGGTRTMPVEIPGIADATGLEVYGGNTCVLRATGGVVCWGANDDGQIGDGTMTARTAPTPVAGLTDARQIAVGSRHACALRATGEVVCWGSNEFGQVGNNDQHQHTVPMPTAVAGLE